MTILEVNALRQRPRPATQETGPILSPRGSGERLPHPPKNVQFSKHEIGQRILALRQQRGMSQVELAAALRIHQTNVSAMERGIRGITVHQLAKLAKVFGVPAQEILGAAASQPPAKKPLKSIRPSTLARTDPPLLV